ncbi:MAG: VOC family protein [Acidobacteriia bacterium]|nr:VOC family protein [Terriglobia bacterium]
MSTFTRITPRLPVRDFQRSLAFYRDTLGFPLY